jgi:hypothetical protein
MFGRGDAEEPAVVEPPASPPALDVPTLVEALNRLSPSKQLAVADAWSGTVFELEHGLSVSVRSKKESRRFTRPMDEAQAMPGRRVTPPSAA